MRRDEGVLARKIGFHIIDVMNPGALLRWSGRKVVNAVS
jgi:hypothetical protein